VNLFNEFKSYCQEQNFFSSSSGILLGVSGGPDSLALLDLFYRYSEEKEFELTVFHLDHGIRQASSEEAKFVQAFCQERDVTCIIEEINLPEIAEKTQAGTEELARRIRRAFYYKYSRELELPILALGHQLNDRIETLLFNLFRGSGIEGLQGIKPTSYYRELKIIRPLLKFKRSTIEYYCQERNLEPRRDKSNKSLKYSRNRIRNELLPYLETHFNPEIISSLASTAEIITGENQFMVKISKNLYHNLIQRAEEHRLDFNCKDIASLDPVLQKRLIRFIIKQLLSSKQGFYQKHYDEIVAIISQAAQEGKNRPARDYHFPKNLLVRVEYGQISFRDSIWQALQAERTNYCKKIVPGSKVKLFDSQFISAQIRKLPSNWKTLAFKRNTALLDYAEIAFPVFVRNREEGDYFYPLGLGGSQKVKDYLINNKIPLDQRDRLPVLVDKDGKILWLAGERIDERVKVTEKTEKVLQLKLVKND